MLVECREVCEDTVDAAGRVAMLIGCSVNQAQRLNEEFKLALGYTLFASLLFDFFLSLCLCLSLSLSPPCLAFQVALSFAEVVFSLTTGRPQCIHDGAARSGALSLFAFVLSQHSQHVGSRPQHVVSAFRSFSWFL